MVTAVAIRVLANFIVWYLKGHAFSFARSAANCFSISSYSGQGVLFAILILLSNFLNLAAKL